MEYQERYAQWLQDSCIDEKTKEELRSIANDEKEIKERFYKELEFGTGGLRGIIGAGSNRLNLYTVGKATQGLANYIKAQGTSKMGVAIAYDSRNMSPEFAQEAGLVLAGNGIPVYIYSSLRPVPMLSFAVRQLGCTAGIVVTASHNPPEYNGYKVYWEDGAQVVAPRDQDIIVQVNQVSEYGQIQKISLEEAVAQGLYHILGEALDEQYYEKALEQRIRPEITETMGEKLRIVYTPLHGAGNIPVRHVLEKAGYKNVFVVEKQELPDGNFTTVGSPNPEDPKVFQLAQELAKKEKAHIILGTDPDCDRIGVMILEPNGEYMALSGNTIGVLLTEYILASRKEKNILPKNGAVIETIVSTKMINPICATYGVEVMEVLTGFKFIGEKIKEFEETKNNTYIFGFEESYGCLIGTHARDKDAVVAPLLFCEMTAYYEQQDKSVYEGLMELYEKYGYYQEEVKSVTLKGLDGVEKIQKIMKEFREFTPLSFGNKKVVWAKDYKNQIFQNIETGEKEKSPLPVADVLSYTLEGGEWICIRPSGTEPKLKFYMGAKGNSLENVKEILDMIQKDLDEKLENI